MAGKWASRASRIFSAARVRSSLFLVVNFGTGKVFHPIVLEYLKSVFSFPPTVAIHVRCSLEERSDMFQIGTSCIAWDGAPTIVRGPSNATGK